MRVTVDVSAYYDWEPVPADVEVTPKDVSSGRVKPAANSGYLMKVTKKSASHTTCCIAESTIIARIIHELMPQQGCVTMSRREAIGQLLARNIMTEHAHPSWMKGFQVDDDGPDEALFRQSLAPYLEAVHHSGQPLIPPDMMESLVSKYMEKTSTQDHVDHLHARFNVKKAVSQ